MNKKLYIVLAVLLVCVAAFFLYNRFAVKSPKETVSFDDQDLSIDVVYSRPYKRGRLIFGEAGENALLPYGKYWRLGANAATEITFDKDVTFAGKSVPAGTYRMYAVPGRESFQISLNSETGVSAAHEEPDYTKDVAKVDVPVQAADETEQFTITFSKDANAANMDMTWDKTRIRIPIAPQ